MKTLQKNSKGGDVKVLQSILKLTPDGDFGNKTDIAVKEFQQKNGLLADGVVGDKTWLKLIESLPDTTTLSDKDYIKVAIDLNVDLACIKAVKTVESGGSGLVNGRPKMLFEGHVFWKELKAIGLNPNTYASGNENILYPSWTKTHYGKTQDQEFARLSKAANISKETAYRSASYGLFQIMGNNCKLCGYKSASEMYKDWSTSELKQLEGFANFIKNSNLTPYLQKYDWAGFAKRYNGPGYAQNKYDQKLKDAYNKFNS